MPWSAQDDRIERFFELLGTVSNFTSAQVQFFRSKDSSVPDFNNAGQMERTRFPYENILALVYEPGLSEKVIEALRTATDAIWPECDDILAFEMTAGQRRNLWSIRGGKK